MMNKIQIDEMNKFFDVRDMVYQTSLCVNDQLVTLTREQLVASIRTFGLQPVKQYLDIRTFSDGNLRHVDGFLSYMDTYLLEMSGGKPSALRELGETLVGKTLTAQSPRLLRLEIVYTFFQNLEELPF